MSIRTSETKVLKGTDQDVTSAASPVFAVTNFTGSAAGIDSDSATHIGSNGSDHSFIDQDVTIGSTPTLAVTNFTGSAAGIDSDSATHIGSNGSDHSFIDQDVTIASTPTLAVTNFTGSAAGLDSDATTYAASKPRVLVAGCELETLNDEESTAIGGSAASEFVPTLVIFHIEDVGVGAAAAGDATVTVGITTGGTEILPTTTLTGLNTLNEHFSVPVAGLTEAITADSTIYCKVTSADSTAGAGHLLDCYVVGETFTSGT